MTGPIRKSVIAGSWYPDNPRILAQDISRYIENASIPDIPQKPSAIISPHAGYMYSGPVAAYAYKTLAGHDYSTVVVISPSHRTYLPYVSVWPKGGFETPLGIVDVDEDLCSRLLLSKQIFSDDQRAHVAEHALEIQLPFLQSVLKPFKLCPLIMGRQDYSLCESLARVLASEIHNPDDVLVVASSDLSHFHSAKTAESMDSRVAERIGDFDTEGLNRDLEDSLSEACGGGPIITALLYSKAMGKTTAKVLHYAHSGHVTGDNTSVVGYLAGVVY